MSELALRPWRDEDLAELARMPADEGLWQWSGFPAGDADRIREWLDRQHRGRAAGDRIGFAVLDDGLVGHVVYKVAEAEVGYWTAPGARRRGVASRALGLLCEWAFEVYQPGRLELIHQVGNAASCRVAGNAGFTPAGILPPAPPWPAEGHRHVRPAAA